MKFIRKIKQPTNSLPSSSDTEIYIFLYLWICLKNLLHKIYILYISIHPSIQLKTTFDSFSFIRHGFGIFARFHQILSRTDLWSVHHRMYSQIHILFSYNFLPQRKKKNSLLEKCLFKQFPPYHLFLRRSSCILPQNFRPTLTPVEFSKWIHECEKILQKCRKYFNYIHILVVVLKKVFVIQIVRLFSTKKKSDHFVVFIEFCDLGYILQLWRSCCYWYDSGINVKNHLSYSYKVFCSNVLFQHLFLGFGKRRKTLSFFGVKSFFCY